MGVGLAVQVVKLLVDNGADVRAADEEGLTALKNAVQGNHGEVAAMLVEAGADPNDVYKVGEARYNNNTAGRQTDSKDRQRVSNMCCHREQAG